MKGKEANGSNTGGKQTIDNRQAGKEDSAFFETGGLSVHRLKTVKYQGTP